MEQTHLYYQESMYVVNQLLLYYRQNIWSKALDRMQSSQLTTGQRNLNKNKISSHCYVAVQLFLLRAQIFPRERKSWTPFVEFLSQNLEEKYSGFISEMAKLLNISSDMNKKWQKHFSDSFIR